MKRWLLVGLIFVALALPVHVHHAQEALSAQSGSTMWGCAPMGQRRNVLYLIDRGARSYVRFSDQRITATLTSDENEQRWSWGSNSITLDADHVASYYEAGTLKARFKCKVR